MKYRVAQDRGVLTPKGAYLLPGTIVNPEDFGDTLENLVQSGFIEAYDPQAVVEEAPTGRTGKVTPGPWTLDPDALADSELDLDELNVMILERDPSMEPFDTREEAIAQLSEDFEA